MNHPRGDPTAQIAKRPKHNRGEYFTYSLKSNNNHGVRGKQAIPMPKTTSFKPKPDEPRAASFLLAGCLANEFLTKGTLLGEKFDSARAQAVPLAALGAEPRRKRAHEPELKAESYAELASLLKTDGAHIPGVVNPTQLARWIQM